MHHIILWKWVQEGTTRDYASRHVNMMADMISDNLRDMEHRIICVTDEPVGVQVDTYPLWSDHDDLPNASGIRLPSCYRRLRLYDFDTQLDLGINLGDRVVSMDIDTIVCGSLREIMETQGRYVGWKVPGPVHPAVFNGSFQMFTAGDLQHIWDTFDPIVSPKIANKAGYFGSDQAWISYNLVGRAGCVGLEYPLIASYPNHVVKLGHHSAKTKLIFFNGSEKPWSNNVMRQTPWVARYWR